MFRRLMASTAVLALMSAAPYMAAAQDQAQPAQAQQPALVQDQTAAPTGDAPTTETAQDAQTPAPGADTGMAADSTAQPAATAEVASDSQLTPEEPTIATAFIGQSVFSSEDPESDNIGEVKDLIIDDQGKITHAVIGVGGFLGIGEKQVAVPFDELEVIEQEGDIRLVYASTKEQLEAAEAYDRTAYDPRARFQEEQAAMAPAADTGMGGGMTTGLAPAPAPAPATDMAAAPAEQPADAATAPAAGEQATADATADQGNATMAPAEGEQQAASATQDNAQPADAAAPAAEEFVQTAGVANMFEIRSSEIALEKSQNSDIQDFAQRMIDDHGKAGEDLKATIEQAGLEVAVPEDLDQEHQDKIAQLESAEGADFDNQYVAMQTEAHEKAVDLFSRYAEGGDNEDLKTFAQNTLPTLEDHHQMIQEIGQSVVASADAAQPADATAVPADSAQQTADATAGQPADAATMPAEGEQMAAGDESAGAAGGADSFLSFNADQVRASTLMGQEVYGPDDESIGEVADLVLQDDGETRAALIDVGGFLGVGEKEVAIPFEQIQVGQDGDDARLTVAMTREEIEALPAFEEPTLGEPVAGTAATDQSTMPAQPSADMAAAPAQPADATATTGQPADMAASADQSAPNADSTEAGAAFATATQDLSAEQLIGAAVYSPDEENLGEVGDVLFDQGGAIEAVVIDVGGFLGLGEKPVAMQFDALNVQKDTNGDLRLMVNASQEELEAAPSYEETAPVEGQTAQ